MIYFANFLGLCAVAVFLVSFQFKKRRNILLCNGLSRVLYVSQYLCLSAFSGAIMDVIGLPITALANRKDKGFVKKHLWLIIILCDLSIGVVGMAMYENVYSLFAIGGVFFETTALWMSKEKHIRLVSLLALPCWLMYNLTCGAYGAIIGNVLGITSIVVSLRRYDFGKKTV